jgi:hypothetical protein
MLAGGKLRDDSSIRGVSRDLRGDDVRENLLPSAHDGSTCFIAGAFNAEDSGVRHNELRGRAMSF